MALDANDLMTLKAMGGNKSDHSSFETYMIADRQSRRPSATAVTGLTLGAVGLLAGVGAWVFGGVFANAKGNQAREAANTAYTLANANHTNTLALMNQQQVNTNATIDRLITAIQRETDARAGGDQTITQTITDTLSGSQSSALTAQQQSEMSSLQNLQNTLLSDAVTGRSSLNPTPVSLYSSPQPCGCPGCNG